MLHLHNIGKYVFHISDIEQYLISNPRSAMIRLKLVQMGRQIVFNTLNIRGQGDTY